LTTESIHVTDTHILMVLNEPEQHGIEVDYAPAGTSRFGFLRSLVANGK
jgi:hypothetical protein